MLAYIKGKLISRAGDYILVENQGLGYKLFIPPGSHARLPQVGEEVMVYTCPYIKEERVFLYGFLQPDDAALFEILLTVSGVGPRVALSIIGSTGSAGFHLAVLTGDLKALTRVPGIGKKIAGRLILELKEKMSVFKGELAPMENIEGEKGPYPEAVEALIALGYAPGEALEGVGAVKKADSPPEAVDDILRAALKYLAGL